MYHDSAGLGTHTRPFIKIMVFGNCIFFLKCLLQSHNWDEPNTDRVNEDCVYIWQYDRPFRKRGIQFILYKKSSHHSVETWLIHVLTKKTEEIEITEKQINSKEKRKLLSNVMNVWKGTEKLLND